MKKKIYSIIVSIFLLFSSNAQPYWEIVASPVDEDLVSVCFINWEKGWILSYDGTLLKTTDGGSSWQSTTLDPGTYSSVHFTDENHGYIVGWQDSSFILKTNDGGVTWNDSYHVKANKLNDIFFIDQNIGWAVGLKDSTNYVLNTDDGGQIWNEQDYIHVIGGEIYSVSFRDQNSGSVCGADGMFMLTSNGGTNWALEISIPSLGADMNSVFNWDVSKGCAVGSSGTALYTNNKWAQYTETVTNTIENLNSVSAETGTGFLWAVGGDGTIIYTSNYLLGWGSQNSGVTESLQDVQMISLLDGWAVGDNGTILHYNIGSNVIESESPNFLIFPNPCRDNINIEFYHPVSESEIMIFDLAGKLIQKQNLHENMRSVTLEVSYYPAGTYFIKIINEEYSLTRKVTIL